MAIFSAIATAITAISSWTIGLGAFGSFAIGNFLLRAAVQLGVSALTKAFASKGGPTSEPFSIQGSVRTGGSVPRSFILGPSLTAGSLVWHSEWGRPGDTPNAYYTQVIALSDLPVSGLKRWFIEGRAVTLEDIGDEGGLAALEYRVNGVDHAWVKFYNGEQTAVDPFLAGTVNANAPRSYSSSRVGKGIAYAIVTFRVNQEIFTGFPRSKFVLDGVKLYDISKDSTQGGTGAHRWNDPATWGGDGDALPAVQAYNLARGIYYYGAWFYGLQGLTAARLPAAHWVNQVEKCRAEIEGTDGLEPIYRCAGEITVNSEIGSAFEAILTSCAGRMSEVGGIFKIYVGAPDAPISHFEDDDIVSLAPQSFTPFYGLSDTVNGIIASYPSPDEGYVMRSTPPLYSAEYEVEDGGRRLMTDVQLSFVPFPAQAQRLLMGELSAARRARRHTHTLPAKFRLIEPGDVVTWTSGRNGYDAKQFRVDGIIDLPNCDLIVDLTEVDPADHGDWDHARDYVDVTPTSLDPVRPTAQGVIGFDPIAIDVQDAAGTARRPGLLMRWNGSVDDIAGIIFEVRVKQTAAVIPGAETRAFDLGELLLEAGLVGATEYEVRAKYIPGTPRAVTWTSWVSVTTNDVRLTAPDFAPGSIEWGALALQVQDEIDGGSSVSAEAAEIARQAAEAAEGGAVAAQGAAVSAADAAIAATLSLGPSEPGLPIEAWARDINGQNAFPAPALELSHLVTGDPDFGECLELPLAFNRNLGPSRAFAFDRSRFYLITLMFKAVSDGSTGGVDVHAGFNTFSGAGATAWETNRQVSLAAGLSVSDGVRRARVLLMPFDRSDEIGGFDGFDFELLHTAASDDADIVAFHVRQNLGAATDGNIRVGLFDVRDITDAIEASTSAAAAFSSEQAALAFSDAAGSSAAAAQSSRIAAEAAQGAADASAAAAASSASTAQASETAAGQNASAAAQSATTAGTAAGGASTSQTAAAASATDAASSASAAAISATVASQTLADFKAEQTDYQLVIDGVGSFVYLGDETASDGGPVLGQVGSVISVTEVGGGFVAGGDTNGLGAVIPVEQALQFSGQRVRVDVLARKPATNAAETFAATYSTAENGNSGLQVFASTTSWEWYSFYYNVPLAVTGESDWVGLWGDADASGKATQFARIIVRLAPVAADIPELGITQAQVDTLSQAVTDAEGNAEASLVFRARTGGAAGEVELVAASDAEGGASAQFLVSADRLKFIGELAQFFSNVEITGDLIVDGVKNRTSILDLDDMVVNSTASSSPNQIGDIFTIDLAPYDTPINPANPLVLEVHGYVKNLGTDAGWLWITLQGRQGAGPWQFLSVGTYTKEVFCYGTGVSTYQNFMVRMIDNGSFDSVTPGPGVHNMDEFRLVASMFSHGSEYIADTVEILSATAEIRQVNFIA